MHRITLAESQFLSSLERYAQAVPGVLAGLLGIAVVIGLNWTLHNYRTKGYDDNKALFSENNLAYALSRAGIIIAQFLGVLPSAQALAADVSRDTVLSFMFASVVTTIGLIAVIPALDYIVLKSVSNLEAMKGGNIAVGLAELGVVCGLGVIANGVTSGSAPTWALAWQSSAAFGGAAMAIVLGAAYVIGRAVGAVKSLKNGVIAAGMLIGGYSLAMSIILWPAVEGDFVDWRPGFASFGAVAVIGIGLLAITWAPLKLAMRASGSSKASAVLVNKDMSVGALMMVLVLVLVATATSKLLGAAL